MAADHVDGDNVDSVSDDEEIWTRAFSADQDTDQQIKNGNKVNATQMRVMTSEKFMEELDQHSVPTTLVEEGDEMNINNKKSADSMSKTETSKDSIVEVESLRTQVLILPKSTTNHPQNHQLFEITKMFKSSKSTLGCHSGWIRRGSSPPSVRCCPGKNKSSRTSDSDFLCYSRSDKNLTSELTKTTTFENFGRNSTSKFVSCRRWSRAQNPGSWSNCSEDFSRAGRQAAPR